MVAAMTHKVASRPVRTADCTRSPCRLWNRVPLARSRFEQGRGVAPFQIPGALAEDEGTDF